VRASQASVSAASCASVSAPAKWACTHACSAGDAAYAAATTVGHLGVVAVLAAFHPVVTIGLAATLLRERVDVVQRIGVAAAVLGVVAVTAA
jgi:uncharacterized membrane protein